MKLPRRRFLQLAAGAAALSTLPRIARAQTYPVPLQSGSEEKVLAERLAAYAHDLRYDDLDAETIERVKSHVIASLGCALAAFDEKPVRICRDVVLANGEGATSWGPSAASHPTCGLRQ
jgi:2-methylcitrate dehydratase